MTAKKQDEAQTPSFEASRDELAKIVQQLGPGAHPGRVISTLGTRRGAGSGVPGLARHHSRTTRTSQGSRLASGQRARNSLKFAFGGGATDYRGYPVYRAHQ